MNNKNKAVETNVERNVALCYIRQSQTRDADDRDSPDRQRENIQIVCDKNGWIPKWFVDASGHKSGTQEKNRPQWLELKKHLGDPDVVALVANDSSRFHRKGWRLGSLIDLVIANNLNLVLAAPGKQQIDLTSSQGKLLAMVTGIFDEFYAGDIADKAKDSIAYRKRKGISVGLPPFGTVRDKQGYLIATEEGAWQLPDGLFLAGDKAVSPDENAIWRGYFEAASRILEMYAENKLGCARIAYKMQIEGWAYRDRDGLPTAFAAEAVRRVISNWAEYGGYVSESRARNRHPHDYDYEKITLIPERAVFSTALLMQVGKIRTERAIGHKSPNHGLKKEDHTYALANIVCCAHCEQNASRRDDVSLRSRLAGMWHSTVPRYRHKNGVKCGCSNRSVKAHIIEAEFSRLLELLSVRDDQIGRMNKIAIDMAMSTGLENQAEDLEAQKRGALSNLQRQLDANLNLYRDGIHTREEYLHNKSRIESEIQNWEAMTTESQKIPAELAACIQYVNQMKDLWYENNDEERNDMVRNLFEYIVFDLDTHRITNFRLQAWANRFITVRGSLYEEETKTPQENVQEEYTEVVPTGLEPVSSP